MNIIDWVAAKFGYIKAPTTIVESEPASTEEQVLERGTEQAPSPATFGLPDDVTFDVIRAGRLGSTPASWADLLDFVDACGVDVQTIQGEFSLASVVEGIPFHIDGADMAFRVRH